MRVCECHSVPQMDGWAGMCVCVCVRGRQSTDTEKPNKEFILVSSMEGNCLLALDVSTVSPRYHYTCSWTKSLITSLCVLCDVCSCCPQTQKKQQGVFSVECKWISEYECMLSKMKLMVWTSIMQERTS